MKQLALLALVVLALLLTGCAVERIDPLGMTERESIRADALVRAAEVEAEAQRRAAEAQADAAKHAATQETVRTGIVAAVVPWALLIVGAIVIGAIVVNWQGRIHYVRAQAALPARPPAQRPANRGLSWSELQALADSQGYEIEIEGRVVYLLNADGERVGRRLLA